MLKALKNTVILELIERENTTASGLIIKGVTEEQTEGRIVSVGPTVDCGIEVGNRVLVDWNRVMKITHEGSTYFVTKQDNLIAVFE